MRKGLPVVSEALRLLHIAGAYDRPALAVAWRVLRPVLDERASDVLPRARVALLSLDGVEAIGERGLVAAQLALSALFSRPVRWSPAEEKLLATGAALVAPLPGRSAAGGWHARRHVEALTYARVECPVCLSPLGGWCHQRGVISPLHQRRLVACVQHVLPREAHHDR